MVLIWSDAPAIASWSLDGVWHSLFFNFCISLAQAARDAYIMAKGARQMAAQFLLATYAAFSCEYACAAADYTVLDYHCIGHGSDNAKVDDIGRVGLRQPFTRVTLSARRLPADVSSVRCLPGRCVSDMRMCTLEAPCGCSSAVPPPPPHCLIHPVGALFTLCTGTSYRATAASTSCLAKHFNAQRAFHLTYTKIFKLLSLVAGMCH